MLVFGCYGLRCDRRDCGPAPSFTTRVRGTVRVRVEVRVRVRARSRPPQEAYDPGARPKAWHPT